MKAFLPRLGNPILARLHPLAFAVLIAAAYLALTLPILFREGRDLSFFIIAGDNFVDLHALPAPILVRPNSNGYDGQFFYRLALAPFSFDNPAAGITFDVPVYRSQRFLYPLLAWIASAGQPAAAAAALFAINLAGIGVIAVAALSLVRRLALSDVTAYAIVAWPGLLVTLTHDTSEIVTVAFLLSALTVRVSAQRAHSLYLYVLLGAAAMLTRETAAAAFAGLFVWDVLTLRKTGWRLALADGLTVVPLLAVHATMPLLWHQTGSEGVLAHVFGWPFIGLGRALAEKIRALISVEPGHLRPLLAALNLGALVLLFVFAGRAVIGAWRARNGAHAWIVAAWLPPALLMAGLGEGDGAFLTPVEFCRVFSEFWALSCLVIAAGSPARRAPLVLAVGMAATVLAYSYIAFEIVRFSTGIGLLFRAVGRHISHQ